MKTKQLCLVASISVFGTLLTLLAHESVFASSSLPASQIAQTNLPYGPNTCVEGYVWREAVPGDQVCVLPETREQARRDNEQASARRRPGRYGSDTCVQGYVWREAVEGDHVCVLPQIRTQAWNDNAQAEARFARNQRPSQPGTEPTAGIWWTNLCLCTDAISSRTVAVKTCMANTNGAGLNCGFLASRLSQQTGVRVSCRSIGIERNTDSASCDPQPWNWVVISHRLESPLSEIASCRKSVKH